MTLSNILLGLATGLPVMLVVGPIALLLVEQGLERGLGGAYPAALGVAGADLFYASLSAVAGVTLARVLEPYSGWLTAGAVLALAALGARLARSAMADLRQTEVVATPALVAAGAGPSVAGPATGAGTPRPTPGRFALAGGFFGITALNPITVVVFATLVIGGSEGAGTVGWVLGMVLASLMVNLGFVAVGHGLGAVLDDTAVARVRLVAAGLIVALALHLALA